MSSIVRIFSWVERLTFYSTRRQPSWIELILIFQRMKIFAPLNEWKTFIICFIQHQRRSNRTLIKKLCFTPYIKDKFKLDSSLLDYIQIAFASDTRRDTRAHGREVRSLHNQKCTAHITKNARPCNIHLLNIMWPTILQSNDRDPRRCCIMDVTC